MKINLAGVFGDVIGGEPVAEANARHIVQCVNAHDELIKSLRSMLDWLDDGNRMLSHACALDVAEARAALAKATGRNQ